MIFFLWILFILSLCSCSRNQVSSLPTLKHQRESIRYMHAYSFLTILTDVIIRSYLYLDYCIRHSRWDCNQACQGVFHHMYIDPCIHHHPIYVQLQVEQPKLVELVEGYGVFLTRQQIDAALSGAATPTKLVRNLMRCFFSPATLSYSTALGRRGEKPALEPSIICACISKLCMYTCMPMVYLYTPFLSCRVCPD